MGFLSLIRVFLLIVSFLLGAEFLAKRWYRGEDGVDRRQPTVQHTETDQGIVQHLIIQEEIPGHPNETIANGKNPRALKTIFVLRFIPGTIPCAMVWWSEASLSLLT